MGMRGNNPQIRAGIHAGCPKGEHMKDNHSGFRFKEIYNDVPTPSPKEYEAQILKELTEFYTSTFGINRDVLISFYHAVKGKGL